MAKKKDKQFDLVTRLREGRTNGTDLRWRVTDTHIEAADEIERLRHIIRQLEDDFLEREEGDNIK